MLYEAFLRCVTLICHDTISALSCQHANKLPKGCRSEFIGDENEMKL